MLNNPKINKFYLRQWRETITCYTLLGYLYWRVFKLFMIKVWQRLIYLQKDRTSRPWTALSWSLWLHQCHNLSLEGEGKHRICTLWSRHYAFHSSALTRDLKGVMEEYLPHHLSDCRFYGFTIPNVISVWIPSTEHQDFYDI